MKFGKPTMPSDTQLSAKVEEQTKTADKRLDGHRDEVSEEINQHIESLAWCMEIFLNGKQPLDVVAQLCRSLFLLGYSARLKVEKEGEDGKV